MRFYTYVSTMMLCLEAAAEAGIEFVVLDRPNPLGGERVEGPVSDPRDAVPESLVNMAPGPLVHGLTAGRDGALRRTRARAKPAQAHRRPDAGLEAHDDLERHRPRLGRRRRRTCAPPEAAHRVSGHGAARGHERVRGPRHRRAVPAARRAVAEARGAGRRGARRRASRSSRRRSRRARPRPRPTPKHRGRASPGCASRSTDAHAREALRARRRAAARAARPAGVRVAGRARAPSTGWWGRRSCAPRSSAATPWTRSWPPTPTPSPHGNASARRSCCTSSQRAGEYGGRRQGVVIVHGSRRLRVLAASALVCASVASARAGEGGSPISVGTELSLRSAVLGETRTIQVALPIGYAERHRHTRYPVLYLLDGQKFFQTVTGVVQHLASDASPRVPDMIVVGVSSQERVRDSSPTHSLRGPLGQRRAGLRAERRRGQVPAVPDGRARALRRSNVQHVGLSRDRRVLLHGRTGDARALHAAAGVRRVRRDRSQLVVGRLRAREGGAPFHRDRCGREARALRHHDDQQPADRVLSEAALRRHARVDAGGAAGEGPALRPRIYDDETHHSVALRSVYDGLAHVFEGYAPSLDTLYAHPERLEEQYRALSQRLGTRSSCARTW